MIKRLLFAVGIALSIGLAYVDIRDAHAGDAAPGLMAPGSMARIESPPPRAVVPMAAPAVATPIPTAQPSPPTEPAQLVAVAAPVAAPTPPSAPTPPVARPADELHDPVSTPGAAWDDVKAAKKVGWAAVVFAVLVMLGKLLGRAKSVSWLAWLGKGKAATVVAAFGALGAACYNAAADGGAWTAMLVAGMTAIGHYLDGGAKEPAET